MHPKPSRGEVWLIDLDPVRGHEQAGQRPCLIVTVDEFSQGPADLVAVLPITGTDRDIPFHTRVEPPEGGLTKTSFVLCDQTRTISRSRLAKRMGILESSTMAEIEDNLRVLLGL